MGILTDDMKRLVDEQQLGFHATVCPDGSPNLSPNLSNRITGLLFSLWVPVLVAIAGAIVTYWRIVVRHEPGSVVFSEGIERLRAAGSKLTGRAKAIVVIEVRHAAALVSPAYDDGTVTEADLFDAHRARFERLHEHRARR